MLSFSLIAELADPPFLGVFPSWVGDLLSILGFPAIVMAILVWVLGRRDANRKLIVEEGSLKRSEFDSVTSAQQADLASTRAELKAVKEESDENADRLDVMDNLYDEMREIIFKLRSMFQKIVRNTSYTLSEEEQKDFDSTKPPARPPRVRAK